MKKPVTDEIMSGPGAVLLTPEEAAGRLRIGRTLIYQLLHTGAIPSVKIGRARRVRVQDVDEFVQSLLTDQRQ
jgi:excisionase family DNA binding protein